MGRVDPVRFVTGEQFGQFVGGPCGAPGPRDIKKSGGGLRSRCSGQRSVAFVVWGPDLMRRVVGPPQRVIRSHPSGGYRRREVTGPLGHIVREDDGGGQQRGVRVLLAHRLQQRGELTDVVVVPLPVGPLGVQVGEEALDLSRSTCASESTPARSQKPAKRLRVRSPRRIVSRFSSVARRSRRRLLTSSVTTAAGCRRNPASRCRAAPAGAAGRGHAEARGPSRRSQRGPRRADGRKERTRAGSGCESRSPGLSMRAGTR